MMRIAANGWLIWATVAVIFLGLAAQIHLAWRDSQTTDEAVHLAAGFTYLTHGDYRMNPEHPPLVKLVAAAPLVVAGYPLPRDFNQFWEAARPFYADSWRVHREFGEAFLFGSNGWGHFALFFGRLGPVLITATLLIVAAVASSRAWGKKAGFVVTTLLAFNPTILAHGHLVTTDVAAALAALLFTLALWRYLQHRNATSIALLGLTLGVALIAKFTTVILIGVTAIAVIVATRQTPRATISTGLKHFAVVAIIAWAVVLAAYTPRWNSVPPPTPDVVVPNDSTTALANIPPTLLKIIEPLSPILRPADFLKGLFLVAGHAQLGHDSFLLGETSKDGWWYYFPVVMLIKLPASVIGLFGLTIWMAASRRKMSLELLAVIIAVSFLAVAMTSKANLGIRHVLPTITLMSFAAGSLISAKSMRLRRVLMMLLLIFIAEAATAYPHALAYINWLWGGPRNGYTLVGDSNVDWGQDAQAIGSYLASRDPRHYTVDYNWSGDRARAAYGITSPVVGSSNRPATRFLIVGTSAISEPRYDWLDGVRPIDWVTPSVLVYDVGHVN